MKFNTVPYLSANEVLVTHPRVEDDGPMAEGCADRVDEELYNALRGETDEQIWDEKRRDRKSIKQACAGKPS
uniref:BRF1 domain-containing protein n=1 Tax=Panagrellus redivivus TaxID=6233 RepID=A0A7E4VBS8_PANRE